MHSTEVFALAIRHWPLSKALALAAEHEAVTRDTIPCPPPLDCEDHDFDSQANLITEHDLSPTLPSGPRVERVTAVLPAPRSPIYEMSDVLW